MPHKNGDRITNHFKMKSPLDKNIDKNFIFICDPYEITYLKKNHILIKKNLSSKKVMKKNFKFYEVVVD